MGLSPCHGLPLRGCRKTVPAPAPVSVRCACSASIAPHRMSIVRRPLSVLARSFISPSTKAPATLTWWCGSSTAVHCTAMYSDGRMPVQKANCSMFRSSSRSHAFRMSSISSILNGLALNLLTRWSRGSSLPSLMLSKGLDSRSRTLHSFSPCSPCQPGTGWKTFYDHRIP